MSPTTAKLNFCEINLYYKIYNIDLNFIEYREVKPLNNLYFNYIRGNIK